MNCVNEVSLAKVYHPPKDNLFGEAVGPLVARSSSVCRFTGDVSGVVLCLYREALATAIESCPSFRMRWITGNRLAKGDILALANMDSYRYQDRRGLLDALREGPAAGQEYEWSQRVLATMIHQAILDWRIAVPEKRGLYHEKAILLRDECGHAVLLSGSWNETLSGYLRNVERIDVHRSTEDPERCTEASGRFERLWGGEEGRIRTVPVLEAIQHGEVSERSVWEEKEEKELIENPPPPPPRAWSPELMYLAIQDKTPWALKDPYVGILVEPLPHQAHVRRRVMSRPPVRFLLADEVGLGKTIEAGLVLSSLVATGLASRILVLAPAHVLDQWRDELDEKFNLQAWRLKGSYWEKGRAQKGRVGRCGLENVPGRVPVRGGMFDALPGESPQILLVSQGVANRSSRRSEFEKGFWDLVIVDEAHRARGRWEGKLYRKNNLLKALEILGTKTASILLLTATPMQLGLYELFDLLEVLGLPPSWRDRDRFQSFIEELDQPDPDWRMLIEMAKASREYYRELHCLTSLRFEEDLASGIEFYGELGPGRDPRETFRRLLQVVEGSALHEIAGLNEPEERLLRILLYRMSPLYQLVCRNTRNLLRLYGQRGIARTDVPERMLQEPVTVCFSEKERKLYDAIENEYVKPFYQEYAKAGLPRHGVGFILTIYRKRAASSWIALEKSFERRLRKLEDALSDWGYRSLVRLFGSVSLKDMASEGAAEADEESELEGAEEEDFDLGPEIDLEAVRKVVQKERDKISCLLQDLRDLRFTETDAKRDALRRHVEELLLHRRGLVVFSQYKDTVDQVASDMYQRFGRSMAKYHGGGGEVWREGGWRVVEKKVVEGEVRSGALRLLVATDAASEGLNLQAMDGVVNYDLPWNPMRIEQRIGRIDRITQKSPKISISVLVPGKTVEEDVYQRCVERLGLFRQAMGPMQPVLVEEYVYRVILGEAPGSAWRSVEDRWEASRRHAELFEKALSLQSFGRGWEERRQAEIAALEHLLNQTGYRQIRGRVWAKGDHRVRLLGSGGIGADEDGDADAELVTALSYDRLFIRLLAELGPMPEQLERGGLVYRVVRAGGSQALAVKHPDGSVFLVRDLSNMEARDEPQVGLDWEAACREVERMEKDRASSYAAFRQEQAKVREQAWRSAVESEVLRPLRRRFGNDLSECARQILSDPALWSLVRAYGGLGQTANPHEIETLLSRVKGAEATRGRKPVMKRILARAGSLLAERETLLPTFGQML